MTDTAKGKTKAVELQGQLCLAKATITAKNEEEIKGLREIDSGSLSNIAVQENEKEKFTFLQACGMNLMFMFGTGPLITVPYCIAAVSPMGPHALIGYGIALVACMCDSCVCGEIGSMWPYSGGTYVYLRELYGSETWGRMAAFIFLWQFLFTGPAEVASGFIAISEYLVYFNPDEFTQAVRILLSLSLLGVATTLLLRNVKDIGSVTLILTGITIFAMGFTLIAGFSDWHPEYLEAPKGAFKGVATWGMMRSVIGAARFGVYDMTGYYDVCFMGEEVVNPRRTIPLSCVITCCVVGVICLFIYLAILGHLDYTTFAYKYVEGSDEMQMGIMSIFTESVTGSRPVACIMTIVVACTIFGSVFSMMLGFAFVLFSAARDGYFFEWFAHKSNTSMPDHALLTIAFFGGVWCFFSLDRVIEAMTTLLVLVQFAGQSAGLLWYRYNTPKEEQPTDTWRMPLYPLPAIMQLVLFLLLFITSPSYLLYGDESATLELSLGFMFAGIALFLIRSKRDKMWPFQEENGSEAKYSEGKYAPKSNTSNSNATTTSRSSTIQSHDCCSPTIAAQSEALVGGQSPALGQTPCGKSPALLGETPGAIHVLGREPETPGWTNNTAALALTDTPALTNAPGIAQQASAVALIAQSSENTTYSIPQSAKHNSKGSNGLLQSLTGMTGLNNKSNSKGTSGMAMGTSPGIKNNSKNTVHHQSSKDADYNCSPPSLQSPILASAVIAFPNKVWTNPNAEIGNRAVATQSMMATQSSTEMAVSQSMASLKASSLQSTRVESMNSISTISQREYNDSSNNDASSSDQKSTIDQKSTSGSDEKELEMKEVHVEF